MGNSAGPSTVQSVDRAVTVLEILARHGERGVTDIAAALGVHKSTASRLASALEARGWVEQAAERGKYRLGVGITRLAGATSARLDVMRAGRPVYRMLAAETGGTVNVGVLWDGAALFLHQVVGALPTLPAYTDATITSRARLHREIAAVRERLRDSRG